MYAPLYFKVIGPGFLNQVPTLIYIGILSWVAAAGKQSTECLSTKQRHGNHAAKGDFTEASRAGSLCRTVNDPYFLKLQPEASSVLQGSGTMPADRGR